MNHAYPKFAAALALGISALGLSRMRRSRSTPRCRAIRRCRLRRARPSSSSPATAWPPTAASSSSAMPGLSRSSSQARGYAPAIDRKGANMVVQLGYGVDRGQTRVRRRIPSYRSRFGYGGFYDRLLLSALRPSAGGYSLRLGRSVLVRRRRHRQLCRISQPDRPPHPRRRNQSAAVRRPRPGPLADQPARYRRAEPGRSDVHRFPGPQRRDG